MVTFGQQYDCTAGDLVMGISGLPLFDMPIIYFEIFIMQKPFWVILKGNFINHTNEEQKLLV